MATVDVRYIVQVYATVDIEAGTVVRVWESDENITRIDDAEGVATMTSGDVLDESFVGEGQLGPDDIANLTVEERERILDIAESSPWPSWERG